MSPSPLNSYEQEKTTGLIPKSPCASSVIEPPTKLHFVSTGSNCFCPLI